MAEAEEAVADEAGDEDGVSTSDEEGGIAAARALALASAARAPSSFKYKL
jgi:hypothetical protein